MVDQEILAKERKDVEKGKYILVLCIKESNGKQSASETSKKLFMKFTMCLSHLSKHAKPICNRHRSYAQSTKHQRHIR